MRFPWVRGALPAALAASLLLGGGARAYAAGLHWSPSGRLLAFWCDSGLYAVNVEQGGVMRLTAGARQGWCAPDGMQVAWSDGSGTYVQRTDATGPVRIAEAGKVAGWSPDSRWVLVESSPPGQAPELYAASPEGKGLLPLAPHPAWDGAAAPSPDGRWVAFASRREAQGTDIWVVAWDGSNLTRVTAMFEAGEPAWSPEGSRLAFSAAAEASSARQVYCLDLRTRKSALAGDGRAPRFVGSDHLAYASGRGIEMADLRTGAKQSLSRGEFSPAGRYLATLSGRPGSLDLLALDTGKKYPVDKGVEAYAWSPDGRWLAYLSLTAGPASVPVRELRINTLQPKGIYTLWSEGLRGSGS